MMMKKSTWAMYNSYDMIINNVDIRDVMVTDVEERYFICYIVFML
jgi:hypothetical protein